MGGNFSFTNMTRLQAAFLILGIILSIVWIGLAWENLTRIVELNPDLFLGLLASGVIVSFREALAQTITGQIRDEANDMIWSPEDMDEVHQESLLHNLKNKVISTIRDIEGFVEEFNNVDEEVRNEVEDELDEELNNVFNDRLKNHRVYEIISLLNRDIEAAYDRLSEFYDENADKSFFHRSRGQLQVVMQDLDEVEGSAKVLNHIFGNGYFDDDRLNDQPAIFSESVSYQKEGLYNQNGDKNGKQYFRIYRTELESIQRSLSEGLNRRDQLDNYLRQHDLVTEKKEHSHLNDLFSVITSDLTKAHKQLMELQSEYRALEDFKAYLIRIRGYVNAALERSQNFFLDFVVEHDEEVHDDVSIDFDQLTEENFVDFSMPKIFYVMVKDLNAVADDLDSLIEELPENGEEEESQSSADQKQEEMHGAGQ